MLKFWRSEKIFFAASSIKKVSRSEEASPEKIKRIAWKFTKAVILLGIAGYELIITNEAYGLVGYIYQLISGASLKNIILRWLPLEFLTARQLVSKKRDGASFKHLSVSREQHQHHHE